MEKRRLGNTAIEVSRLCFGSLTMGPLQANLSPKDGGDLLLYGFEQGINFIDTAELYANYGHIRQAIEQWDRSKVMIATKSYSYSKETAEQSLKKALEELDTDYIDMFLLHEQESEHTLRGHYEALEYFMKMKEKGYIRSVGISTHTIAAVKASLKISEIEVLHPIVNKTGIGIQDGTIDEMVAHLQEAHRTGKGIYGMKPLGGGNLLKDFRGCFEFVLQMDCLDSIAVGMQSREEIEANVKIFQNKELEEALVKKIMGKERKLHIAEWCEGCKACVKACRHNALEIKDNRARVIPTKCVLCSYCAKYCPQFCIKVV